MLPRIVPNCALKLLPVCAVVVATATVRSAVAEKPKLAVMPLAGMRVDDAVTRILTDILTVRASELGRYDVISADEIKAMLGMESLKQALACEDVACAAELSGALGVGFMLTGNVGRLGNELNIKLAFFDSARMRVLKRVLVHVPDDETKYREGINKALRSVFEAEQPAKPAAIVAEPAPQPVEQPPKPPEREVTAKRPAAERRAKNRKQRLERAWTAASAVAADKQVDRGVRGQALDDFVAEFPDNNPYAEKARELKELLSHGRLIIETQPKGAEVSVNEEHLGTSPIRALYPPGDYSVSAQKDGYFDADERIAIAIETDSRVNLMLREKLVHPYVRWGNIAFWTGAGVGGLLAVIGQLGASSAADSYRNGHFDEYDTNHTFSAVAVTGLVVAGIGIAAGLILWGMAPDDESWMTQAAEVASSPPGAPPVLGRR